MNNSFDKANALAKDLGRKYKKETWFNGVSVDHDEISGFYVTVRTTGKIPNIPSSNRWSKGCYGVLGSCGGV